jgi:hypothetical protein
VNAKDMIATRKTEFRKVIDDADFLSEWSFSVDCQWTVFWGNRERKQPDD